jgi:integrase
LTDDERARLLTACRASKWDRLYVFALMALTTGARRGELEGLRWRDVDLERGEATIERSKNGDRKVLPLVPNVTEELRRFAAAPDSLMFASRRRPHQVFNATPVWHEALRLAGIKDFRFHDCRHDAASTLARAGASLLEIQQVLGHKTASMSLRYSHLSNDHKNRLVRRVMSDIGVEA